MDSRSSTVLKSDITVALRRRGRNKLYQRCTKPSHGDQTSRRNIAKGIEAGIFEKATNAEEYWHTVRVFPTSFWDVHCKYPNSKPLPTEFDDLSGDESPPELLSDSEQDLPPPLVSDDEDDDLPALLSDDDDDGPPALVSDAEEDDGPPALISEDEDDDLPALLSDDEEDDGPPALISDCESCGTHSPPPLISGSEDEGPDDVSDCGSPPGLLSESEGAFQSDRVRSEMDSMPPLIPESDDELDDIPDLLSGSEAENYNSDGPPEGEFDDIPALLSGSDVEDDCGSPPSLLSGSEDDDEDRLSDEESFGLFPCGHDEDESSFEDDEEEEEEEDLVEFEGIYAEPVSSRKWTRAEIDHFRNKILPEKDIPFAPRLVYAALYLFTDQPKWKKLLPKESKERAIAFQYCVSTAALFKTARELTNVLEALQREKIVAHSDERMSFLLTVALYRHDSDILRVILEYCVPLFTTKRYFGVMHDLYCPFPSQQRDQFSAWLTQVKSITRYFHRDDPLYQPATEEKKLAFWFCLFDDCPNQILTDEENAKAKRHQSDTYDHCISALNYSGAIFDRLQCPIADSSFLQCFDEFIPENPAAVGLIMLRVLSPIEGAAYVNNALAMISVLEKQKMRPEIIATVFHGLQGMSHLAALLALAIVRCPELRTLRPDIKESLRREYCFFMLGITAEHFPEDIMPVFRWFHDQDLFTDHPNRTTFCVTTLAHHGALEPIKILSQLGVDISRPRQDNGESPLMAACRQRHVELMVWLIQHGADVLYPGFENGGSNPFRIAASTEDDKLWSAYIDTLLEQAKASRLPLLQRLVKENKAHPKPDYYKMSTKAQTVLTQALHAEKSFLQSGSNKKGGKKKGKKGRKGARKAQPVRVAPSASATLLQSEASRYQKLLAGLRDLISRLDVTAEESKPSTPEPTEPTPKTTSSSSAKTTPTSLAPPQTVSAPEEGTSNDADSSDDEEDVIEFSQSLPTTFEECRWEVVLTDKARRQWSSLDPLVQEEVRKKLLVLADGYRSISASKKIIGVPSSLKLYESKFSKGGRILWEEAVDFSYRHSSNTKGAGVYTDLIRVWFVVLDHDQVPRYINQCIQSHRAGLAGRITRTMVPQGQTSTKQSARSAVVEPRVYAPSSNAPANTKDAEGTFVFPPASAEEDVEDNKLCSIEKFYSLSQALASNILTSNPQKKAVTPEGRFDYPFRVSEVEYEVIKRSSTVHESTLLIGRSGTGKTTCALYRMWFQFLQHHQQPASGPLRQLFITANPVLRGEMERIFDNLRQAHFPSSSSIYFTPEECAQGLNARPPTFRTGMSAKHFPLFLSSREWVLMLDGTLPEPFFRRRRNGALRDKRFLHHGNDESRTLLLSLRHSLPEEEDAPEEGDAPASSSKVIPREEVDCEYFVRVIWPRIKPTRGVNLDPSLVFTEIYSFIKGSVESLQSPQGYLTREQYQSMGKKRAGTFVEERDLLYDLFEKYEAYKHQCRWEVDLFDWMDVVHNAYCQLTQTPYSGELFDLIIHDEVQDATQAELSLYFLVSRDANSMFFTGDTCQTIARGVSFRFADLRSLFHYRQQTQPTTVVPPLTHLVRNYRSHGGITNLSSAIVELMKFFSPTSFDSQLPRDQGILEGDKPLLIQSTHLEHLLVLLFGHQRSEENVDFGADQVILVMNQSAKARLPPELKRDALCLSVFESKGLEFNDVLLFNFFSDSQAENNWRAVDQYQDQHRVEDESSHATLIDHAQEESLDPTVSAKYWAHQEQTKSLSHELKFLYTAVTRARENIWIYDQDSKARQPIFRFFERRGLATVISGENSSQSLLSKMQSSHPKRWRDRAEKLYERKLYEAAEKCYRKCDDLRMASHCAGQQLLVEAQQEGLTAIHSQITFLQAAEAFLESKDWKLCATCLMKATAYDVARTLFAKIGETQLAADCTRLHQFSC